MNKPKIYPPSYLLVFLLTELALQFLLPVLKIVPSPWNAFGVIFLIAGIVMTVQADGLFRRAGTTVQPDGDPSTLVTQGVFRISRNPMYFGFALILFGVAFLFGSLTPFLTVPLFLVLIEKRFILAEEKMLEKEFKQAYLEYRQSVRRWI
jgi:protein-S-isoprenylcysteine O-methyltransferase Ste14